MKACRVNLDHSVNEDRKSPHEFRLPWTSLIICLLFQVIVLAFFSLFASFVQSGAIECR